MVSTTTVYVQTKTFSATLDSRGNLLVGAGTNLYELRWDSPSRTIVGVTEDLGDLLSEVQTEIRQELAKIAPLGYREDHELSFRKGQQVKIPKGVMIRSTNPSRRKQAAGRAYKIVIHHFMPGQSIQIGNVLADGTVRHDGCIPSYLEDEIRKAYGAPSADLLSHPFVHQRGKAILIPLKNPTVCWVGTGSYWCEVDITKVLAV